VFIAWVVADSPWGFVDKEINIYVGLTEIQRKWYRSVLEKDIDAVNGKHAQISVDASSHVKTQALRQEGKTRLMNMSCRYIQRCYLCVPCANGSHSFAK